MVFTVVAEEDEFLVDVHLFSCIALEGFSFFLYKCEIILNLGKFWLAKVFLRNKDRVLY